MLKQAVVFCAVLALASAFLEQWTLQPIPEKFKGKTGCYIPELDAVMPFGKTTPSKVRCVEYRCHDGGVTVTGCGTVSVSAPCTVVEDETKRHPDCCPTIKCP